MIELGAPSLTIKSARSGEICSFLYEPIFNTGPRQYNCKDCLDGWHEPYELSREEVREMVQDYVDFDILAGSHMYDDYNKYPFKPINCVVCERPLWRQINWRT